MSEHLSEHAVANLLDGTAWIEIAAAFVAYFVLAFLWWGPLFGRKWARLSGMDPESKPTRREMGVAMVLQVVATFLTAFVLWHVMTAFTIELAPPHGSELSVAAAVIGAIFTWLGFFVPVQLGRVAWEKAPWGLFGINVGGQLVGLVAMSLLFALL